MPVPDLHRSCSECGVELGSNIKQKTCSVTCRGRRSRRLARERKRENLRGQTPGTAAISKMVRQKDQISDVARDVMQDELRPVVREAITEDTLRAIQRMVALTPAMVAAITEDLVGVQLEDGTVIPPDPQIRQKAYTLLARYTIGHGAIVQPEQQDPQNQLVVVFDGMKRPEQPSAIDAEVVQEPEEVRTCLGCARELPSHRFVGRSDRCQECHDALKARAEQILEPKDD